MFFIPILALDRTKQMKRASVPPVSFVERRRHARPEPAPRIGPVAGLGLFGQWIAALAFAVDVAFQFQVTQLLYHFLEAMRRIGPHARDGMASASRWAIAWLSIARQCIAVQFHERGAGPRR